MIVHLFKVETESGYLAVNRVVVVTCTIARLECLLCSGASPKHARRIVVTLFPRGSMQSSAGSDSAMKRRTAIEKAGEGNTSCYIRGNYSPYAPTRVFKAAAAISCSLRPCDHDDHRRPEGTSGGAIERTSVPLSAVAC